MKLGYNWFYRPSLDVEMKQYEALAFVQYLEHCLQQRIFAPPYLELTLQQNVISQFLNESGSQLYTGKRTLEGIDWNKKDLVYSAVPKRELMPVEKIASFLLKRIRPFKARFETLRNEVRNLIDIQRVGLLPSYCSEGWLLLGGSSNVDVYAYRAVPILDAAGGKNIETFYYTSYKRSTGNTPESIKLDLVKQHRDLPNPATYFVNYVSTYPLESTYLPLVREKLAQETLPGDTGL